MYFCWLCFLLLFLWFLPSFICRHYRTDVPLYAFLVEKQKFVRGSYVFFQCMHMLRWWLSNFAHILHLFRWKLFIYIFLLNVFAKIIFTLIVDHLEVVVKKLTLRVTLSEEKGRENKQFLLLMTKDNIEGVIGPSSINLKKLVNNFYFSKHLLNLKWVFCFDVTIFDFHITNIIIYEKIVYFAETCSIIITALGSWDISECFLHDHKLPDYPELFNTTCVQSDAISSTPFIYSLRFCSLSFDVW